MEYSFGAPILTYRDEEAAPEDADLVLINGNGHARTALTPADGLKYDVARGEWLEARRAFRNLRIADDSMSPIVAEGAHVAYAEAEQASEALHEKLVVAWVEGSPIVRWFQHCGRFALLRAENPNTNPPTILVDLDRPEELAKYHRVLWISTPHQ